MKYIALIFSLFFGFAAFSQENTLSEEETKELNKTHNEIIGTYQIQVLNSRINPVMHLSAVRDIQKSRTKSDTTYIQYPEKNYRIMVLPQNTINGESFEPVERITYITTK